MASEKVLKLTSENFEKEVITVNIPVLVDFWAEWCGPCKMIASTIDALAEEFEGKAKVCKVDITENEDLAIKYKVMSIPTVLIFKNGEVVKKEIGARTKSDYADMINSNL